MPSAPKSVGTLGYWLGSGMLVLAVIVVAATMAVGFTRVVDLAEFPQQVGSDQSVWIEEPDGYVIFVIRPDTMFVSVGPSVSVTGPDGKTIPTGVYSSSRTATRVDGSGVTWQATAVATFEAPESGTYRITASDLDAGSELGIGDGIDGGFGFIGFGIFGGSLLGLAGLVLLIVTAVRRSRQRTATPWNPAPPMGMVPQPYPGGPYPAPTYPGQTYPGQNYPGQAYPGQVVPAPGSLVPPEAPKPPPGYVPPVPPTPPPVPPPGSGWPPPASGPGAESDPGRPRPWPP